MTLFGIATRNGVLLVNRYQQLMRDGVAMLEAIRQGSRERQADGAGHLGGAFNVDVSEPDRGTGAVRCLGCRSELEMTTMALGSGVGALAGCM